MIAHHRTPIHIAICCAFFTGHAAYAQSMQEIPDFTTAQNGSSIANAVSADGSTVVGNAGNHGFVWTAAGMQEIKDFTAAQTGYSDARAVSADGSTVIGEASYGDGSKIHGFVWTAAGMQEIKDFTSAQNGNSTTYAVSADGSAVIGIAQYNNGIHGFVWTAAGMQEIKDFTTAQNGDSYARGVSADGSTVVGDADYDNGRHGFVWTAAGTQEIKDFTTAQNGYSTATAVSADGSTVIGDASYGAGSNIHGFVWTAAGMQEIKDFTTAQNGYSSARAVSADGNTVVGHADYDNGRHGFVWTAAGMQEIKDFTTAQNGDSSARGVSADGSTVVGDADYDNGRHGFVWTAAGMQEIKDFTTAQNGDSSVNAMSADGSTVVGDADYDNGRHGFVWTAAGTQEIKDFTTAQNGYSTATAVSADGSTVVGQATNDAGLFRAFIYRTKLQDTANLMGSFPKVGADKELAAAQHQNFMGRMLETQGSAAAGRYFFQINGSFDQAGSDGVIGRRSQTQGIATLGYGLSETLTVGANLSMAHSSLRHSAVNAKNGYGLSAWLKHSASGASGTGLQVAASLGGSKQNTDVTRGVGLSHVEQITGSSNLKSFGARVAVGFGMAHSSGWLVTPQAALEQKNTTFGGYNETSGDFRASYAKSKLKTTVLDLGVTAQKSIGSQSTVMLGAGLEQDLSADRMRLKGSSNIPGMEVFDTDTYLNRKKTRPYLTAGYQYNIAALSALSARLRVGRDEFSSNANVGVDVAYRIGF